MLTFTMMALGLNVVVGYAGLLDLGYVAFYAAGAYVAGGSRRSSSRTSRSTSLVGVELRPPGIHISMWLDPRPRGAVHDARRDRHRPADAAPARRLPRDRDPRLRRDRPAVRAERRLPRRLRPDERHVRDRPIDSLAFGAFVLPRGERTRTTSTTGPRVALSCSPSSAASGSATRGSGARGSRSARTRPRPRRWASR